MSHKLHTRVAAAGSRMQCAPHAFTASHVITPAAQGRRQRRRRRHRPGQAAQHGMNVVCDKGKQEQRKRGTRNRGTRHTSHVTRHTSYVTRHTSHVTRHTSHVTRHTSHVTRHTSHVTRHPAGALALRPHINRRIAINAIVPSGTVCAIQDCNQPP